MFYAIDICFRVRFTALADGPPEFERLPRSKTSIGNITLLPS